MNLTNFLLLSLIPFIIIMVYDYTDFPREFLSRFYNIFFSKIFKHTISKESVRLPKILECSFCATFWCSLVFCICTMPFSIKFLIVYIAIALGLAFLSNYYYLFVMMIDSFLKSVFYKLNKKIQK